MNKHQSLLDSVFYTAWEMFPYGGEPEDFYISMPQNDFYTLIKDLKALEEVKDKKYFICFNAKHEDYLYNIMFSLTFAKSFFDNDRKITILGFNVHIEHAERE